MFRRSLLAVVSAAALSIAPLAAAPPVQAPPPVPADLAARFASWLDTVALLMKPKEREVFLALAKDYQRDAFIRRFWEVRDPFPQTARNEFQERWETRAEAARERFGNLTDDRAQMMLYNGEPAHVLQARCEVLLPLEIWDYPGSEKIRGDFSLVFVARGSTYHLWSPSDGIEWLLAQSLRVQSPDLARSLQAVADLCPRGEDVAARLGEAVDWRRVESALQLVPQPGEEWLSTFSSFSTEVPAGAPSFPAQVEISFPSRFGSRTVMQALVSVPRQAVSPERLEGSTAAHYSFVVDGEVLYKGDLFEHFRYRFALPEGEVTSDSIPVVFQRYLRPGSYSLVVKVEDAGGKRFFRDERELEVPAVEAAPAAPPDSAPLAEANAAIGSDEQSIRLMPPPPGLVTGKLRVEAATTGAVARVSFELDGRPILAKSRPPYSVELNLGEQPRAHTLRALALAEDGRKLAEDEIQLNVGPHRFALRLVEPEAGKTYRSSVRAQAQVEVPEGERLDRVEFFLNDERVATLYQPPFSQPLFLAKSPELTYVRAVAYLDGGTSTEDLVLINAPDFTHRVDIDFVELYTSVVDNRGRPVEGLAKEDFTVVEDDVTQEVRRFERIEDVPIYAGILLDTSASMGEAQKLDQAVRGALRFFQKVITPKDRAAVITFSDQPTLAVRFTNQEPVLAGGLAGLTAAGNTALHDSLIYALYYFGGVKGKRALVILSDGKDEGSRYSFNESLEYARRSGVALYTVGIGLSTRDSDARLKLSRLADETGGRFFFIAQAGELEGIYDTIQKELRSQYLLAYQSSKEGDADKFRTVEVKVAKPGMEAKTVRGYYP